MKTMHNDKALDAAPTAPQRPASGMTLVELLIVLSIIALLSSIAVPAFLKMIGSSQTDVDKAAAQVHKLLQTARIYAMSHHVRAGLAYRVALKAEETAPPPDYCDVVGFIVWDKDANCFVPAPNDPNMEFHKFPGTSCLIRPIPETDYPLLGLTNVRIRFQLDNPNADRPLTDAEATAQGLTGNPKIEATTPIYAHVFEPSGAMEVESLGLKERYEIVLRSLDPPIDEPVENIVIELYRSTGRVKVINP